MWVACLFVCLGHSFQTCGTCDSTFIILYERTHISTPALFQHNHVFLEMYSMYILFFALRSADWSVENNAISIIMYVELFS